MGSGLSKQQGELPLAYALHDRSRGGGAGGDGRDGEAGTGSPNSHQPPGLPIDTQPRHGHQNSVPVSLVNPSFVNHAAAAAGLAQRTRAGSQMPVPSESHRPIQSTTSVQQQRLTQSYSLNDLDSFDYPPPSGGDNPSALVWASPLADEADDTYDLVGNILEKHAGNVKTISFAQLTNIATIGLCNQYLLAISPNVGLLATTTTLHLCCNNLTEIPPEIGHLKNLTNLHVSSNKLTFLPDTIGYLTRLVELQASNNLLTSLPTSIASLRKLTNLDLKKNRIQELPPQLGQLKSLVTLDVSENPIQRIPAELNRLKFLRKITLDDCPLITEFPVEETFSPPSLKELAGRVIVRQQLPILEITHSEIKTYLASAKQCTFCSGPYFEKVHVRGRIVERGDASVPLEYRLCSPHWNTDQERLAAMFCPLPDTAPSPAAALHPSSSLSASPASSPPGSPAPGGRRKRTSMTRSTSSSATLPLSSLAKNPSLPSLPAAAIKSGKQSLLRRNGLRASRSLSFISLSAGH